MARPHVVIGCAPTLNRSLQLIIIITIQLTPIKQHELEKMLKKRRLLNFMAQPLTGWRLVNAEPFK